MATKKLKPKLTVCPICNGDQSIYIGGSGRIMCPGCEGSGKVFDLGQVTDDKNAEKDRKAFLRMKGYK